ncbi:MAG: translation initiation factor IF-2 [Clostridia bacterium]|nr:translation initiation factor IF-2 [Clostridia bacterium]
MGLHDKYRLHEISKDFNLNSNEILDILTEYFGEAKTNHMTALSKENLDLLLDKFIQDNASEDVASYFAAMTGKKEAKKAEPKKAEAPKKAEEKEAPKKTEAKKTTPKKEKQPKTEVKAEEKTTAKPETSTKKEKAPAEAKKAPKTEQKAKAPEAKKPAAEEVKHEKTQPVQQPKAKPQTKPEDKKERFEKVKSDLASGDRKQKENKPAAKPQQTNTRINIAANNNDSDSPAVTVAERDDKPSSVPGGKFTKVVDTRTQININHSKYDERLNDIAGNQGNRDYGKSKQKIVKKNKKQDQFKSKKEDEQARLKRIEQYEKDKKKHLSNIVLPEQMSVSELAAKLSVTNAEVVKKLMMLGIMASASQIIDYDTASLVAEDFGAVVSKEVIVTIEDKLIDDSEDNAEDLIERSPVVVVMGHVDHGKTSILDAIRKTNVASGEAGGITQHIGAYTVTINEKQITFLDTPGHAAFTSMRMRGAQLTDIAVLVVAGDDGIMPQTVEAINHAKAAGVPIIVAVNKMDKHDANFDKVMQALTEYELVPEEWGGDTICVPVSALTGMNIDKLLEMILLVAEFKELKANPNRDAKGAVVEARLDKGRGPVATVLVQNGTLRQGDSIVAGTSFGRIRGMMDDKGKRITEAPPSTPVEIIGFAEVPSAGDIFHVVQDERMAKELVEQRKHEQKEELYKNKSAVSLDDLFNQIQEGNMKELNIIVKADVQGSAEAVKASLEKLSNEEVRVKVIHSAVGAVNESDVMLASASNAIIVGFNVRPEPNAKKAAEKDKVDLRLYRIIYDCIEEIETAMKGILAPKFREVILGNAEVRQTFKVSGVGTIAGCYVRDGKITRSAGVRIVRDGIVIYEGKIDSLKRFKDDAKEVAAGYECGLGIEKYNDLKEGDVIEAYTEEEIER